MKVLIVDDDKKRAIALKNYLIKTSNANSDSIDIALCIDAAKHLLRHTYYDALVLDVVLPKREDEKPNSKHCISLLHNLNRGGALKKPEKIIGLTAHIDDIGDFRSKFDDYCIAVIQATHQNSKWKTSVSKAINYTASSKIARKVHETPIHVVTIHGIRTFGKWQSKLEGLVKRESEAVSFGSYKYGRFSSFSFAIPIFRIVEIVKLTENLKKLSHNYCDKQFVFFCHSFGTYLLMHALRRLKKQKISLNISLIVLSGSVLDERFNFEFLHSFGNPRLVNDCCTNDYVLWLSKAFIIGTGMAGKVGFCGMQDDRFINRYFIGGHSTYFDGDEFMKKHWLPLLDLDSPINCTDMRSDSVLEQSIIEKTIIILSYIKIPINFLPFIIIYLMLA